MREQAGNNRRRKRQKMVRAYLGSLGLWKTLSLALSLISILFLVADHYGFSDWWLGIDTLKRISARFNRNTGPDASLPVYEGDPEWDVVLSLVTTYSNVAIPIGKQSNALAREPTTLSAAQGPNQWTVPITRLVLFFYHWPEQTGRTLTPNEDYIVIGTLGDFQSWISQKQADFHFKVKDLIIGMIAFVLAILSATPRKTKER
jgi:hypothetical protein